jgi:hypothetical protein
MEVFIFVVERRTQFYFRRYDIPTVLSREYAFVVFRDYEIITIQVADAVVLAKAITAEEAEEDAEEAEEDAVEEETTIVSI